MNGNVNATLFFKVPEESELIKSKSGSQSDFDFVVPIESEQIRPMVTVLAP